jgi:hypothetical protein
MKKNSDLKDKEQALIDAALRELATRKSSGATATAPHRAPAAPAPTPKGTVAGTPNPTRNPKPTAPTIPVSPIDHPTVDGWNHPAAHDPAPKVKIAVEEKWARVAAAMEMEQRESREARDRMRRMGKRLAIGAAVVIFIVIVSVLH